MSDDGDPDLTNTQLDYRRWRITQTRSAARRAWRNAETQSLHVGLTPMTVADETSRKTDGDREQQQPSDPRMIDDEGEHAESPHENGVASLRCPKI